MEESDLLADADAADAAEAAAEAPAPKAAPTTVLDQAEAQMHVSDSDARDEFEKLLAGLGGVDQSWRGGRGRRGSFRRILHNVPHDWRR